MFRKLLGSWKSRTSEEGETRNPILVMPAKFLTITLDDKSEGIGKAWSEDGKRKLFSDVIADIEQQLATPNPLQAVRMRTIEFMILSAKFDVLIMQEPTPFMGLSGQLKPLIPDLIKADSDLQNFFSELGHSPTSFDEMYDPILMRYWVMHLYMNTYNHARRALKDFNEDRKKDWFHPCYISLCLWQENKYRQALGLPLTIVGDMAELKVIAHSAWIMRADEGHPNLRLVWEKAWQDSFDELSPYANVSEF